jgi:hypothetical protein
VANGYNFLALPMLRSWGPSGLLFAGKCLSPPGTQKKSFVLFFGFGYFRSLLPILFDLKFSVLVPFVRLKVPFGSGKRPSFVPSRGKFSFCIGFAQYLFRCIPACLYNGVPLYWCHFRQACVWLCFLCYFRWYGIVFPFGVCFG